MPNVEKESKVRNAEGGAYESRGRFYARVTVAPQKRESVLLPWCSSMHEALARAKEMQLLASSLRGAGQAEWIPKILESAATADSAKMGALAKAVEGIVGGSLARAEARKPTIGPLTFRAFAEQWTSGELSRQYPDHIPPKRTAEGDAGRFEKWVFPVLGDELALSAFTLDHAQEVLRRIPRVKSAATRRHVAQAMNRLVNLAVYPCRILTASPLPRGFLPKLATNKAHAYLYPDEEAKLLACRDIPLAQRLLYGVLTREGMRSEEAHGLLWSDVDLIRGAIRLDQNKTKDPRAWTLGRDVLSALGTWRAMNADASPGDPIFSAVRTSHVAEGLRADLKLAGVNRAELFERSESRRPLRAHDTRATFVTLALATGKSESWVADRTGHRSSIMINRYRRAARMVEELGLGWLAALDQAIPELAEQDAAAGRGGNDSSGSNAPPSPLAPPAESGPSAPIAAGYPPFKSSAYAIPPRGRVLAS